MRPVARWGALLCACTLAALAKPPQCAALSPDRAPSPNMRAPVLPLRCPPRASTSQCLYIAHQTDEYSFMINSTDLTITYGVKYLQLRCPNGVSLDSGLLPTFSRVTAIPRVMLRGCVPPATGLAPALVALNVSLEALSVLQLLALPPTLLTAAQFLDLHLTSLSIAGAGSGSGLQVSADFLRTSTITELRLNNINVSSDLLHLLPSSIRLLSIKRTHLEELPAAALRRLSALERLEIQSDNLREAWLAEARSLRALELISPLTVLSIGAALVNVTLNVARAVGTVVPGGECHVRRLLLVNAEEAAVRTWLERCATLRTVHYRCASGRAAGRVPLGGAGAGALRELVVRGCRLRDVAPDWLAAAPRLVMLDLAHNDLQALPRELLATSEALEWVSLRATGAGRGVVPALAAATSLRTLDLADNPLGDLCPAADGHAVNAVSALARLRRLRELLLARTGAARLCSDWRRDLPALARLDLAHNNVTELQWEDLQWSQSAPIEVDLRGNPLRDLRYSRDDYSAALRAPADLAPATTIRVDSELQCDCGLYWYARALRERPEHRLARVHPLRCAGGAPLDAVPLRALTCAVPGPPCPASCSCQAHGAGAVVRCERAGLSLAPALPVELRPLLELSLAHNDIASLALGRLPDEIAVLNLSYNRIERVAAADVTALLGDGVRQLALTGNPLRCECDAEAGLAALRLHAARLADWPRLRCADGRPLATLAPTAVCPPPPPPAPGAGPGGGVRGALAALAAAVTLALVSLAVFLTSPRVRKRIKWFLASRGVCVRWTLAGPEGAEGGADYDRCEYDAFVSFAHEDGARALALTQRLEARGRRLCLHQRDWVPGELITSQIAASVSRSRRTVALLSDAFLASAWARAEFRSAWALTQTSRAPRLLLVLLPELSAPRDALPAALDGDLAAFVASNTYLEWDDPRFWEKLERAVPAHVPAAPAPPERERY